MACRWDEGGFTDQPIVGEAIFQRTINDSLARDRSQNRTEHRVTVRWRQISREHYPDWIYELAHGDRSKQSPQKQQHLKPTEVVVLGKRQQQRQRLFLGDFRISLSLSEKTVEPWIQLNLSSAGQLPINKHEEQIDSTLVSSSVGFPQQARKPIWANYSVSESSSSCCQERNFLPLSI